MTEESNSNMEVDAPTPKDETKKKDNITPSASGVNASKYPDMSIAQSIHKLLMVNGPHAKLSGETATAAGVPTSLNEDVLKSVTVDMENAPLYRQLGVPLKWDSLSADALKTMEEKNSATMESLEKKVEETKENSGDMEVLDARFEVARFAAKSLSKDDAMAAYEKVLALPKLSSGKTMDALMESARVASFYGDLPKTRELVEKVSHFHVQVVGSQNRFHVPTTYHPLYTPRPD